MIGRRTKGLSRTMTLCDPFLTKSKGRVKLRSRAQSDERITKSQIECANSTEGGRILSQRRRFGRLLRDERFQQMRMIAKSIVS
jgi:hypothetical protein